MLALFRDRRGLATAFLAGALLLLAGSLAYVAPKVLSDGIAIDFRFIWLAGSLWSEGIDPYTAAYGTAAGERLRPGNVPEFLLYPPGWWGIAVGFAAFDEVTASLLWRMTSVLAAALGAGALLWAVARATGTSATGPRATGARATEARALLGLGAAALALTFGSVAAANNITIAQTSMLVLLGGGFAAAGVVAASRPVLITGLLILSLKPSIGLAFVPLVLLLPTPLLSTAALGILVLAISAPPLLEFGPITTATGFIESAARYGALEINAGPALTGLRHLAWLATGTSPSAMLMLALCGILSAAGMVAARRIASTAEGRALGVAFAVSCLLCVAPLHSYDFVFLLPLMLLIPLLGIMDGAVILGAVLFTLRSSNIAPLLGLVPSDAMLPGTTVATIAGLGLFLWFGLRLALAIRTGQKAA
ncbi:MAG: hypothetical protein AAFP67_03945 [Pseudomonadota bacterium]